MSSNIDNDRSVTTGKMYPIDLAPQKITIVKNVSNSEVKMAHLISGQAKISGSSQLGNHGSSGSGLMRPGLAQIISPNASSQPQMILGSSPLMQGTQIVSQGSQLHSQNTQILSQSQILPSGQLLSPGTQIISQGTQLSAQVSTPISSSNNVSSVASSIGTQVLNVGAQLGSTTGNLLVNTGVRTLPPTVRVLPPLGHHNTRPAAIQLSNVNVSSASNVLVNKSVNVGITSHVPRGLAAGASLALRPVTPSSVTQSTSNQGGGWGNTRAPRGALVYNARARAVSLTGAALAAPVSAHQPHSAVVTLSTGEPRDSIGVISGSVRVPSPRAPPLAPAPRPLPLLQRNYQPAKVVGVSSVGVRGVVGNSAPTQLYYEVPRAATPHAHHGPRALAPYALTQQTTQAVNTTGMSLPETRPTAVSIQSTPLLAARPTILRKRDVDGSPTKSTGTLATVPYSEGPNTGWEDVMQGGRGGGSGGSTTMSASSSPPPEEEPEPPQDEHTQRKKPRKQLLTNDVRQCEFPAEESAPSPPPVSIQPPPKRITLSSSYVCGWRSTALHFVRPGDVRKRDSKPRDIVAIASQKHVLTSAEGWKVHHLTAQMDDLMSLESDVGSQLAGLLRALENASGKAHAALQPHSHSLLELLKGNIQRSKIVCEGIQEAREDILRVFTHRKSVSDILTRQADKRCFRKHRSQS